jgi:hypothetical protein
MSDLITVPASGGYVYNGVSWDRARSAIAMDGSSSPTGVPGVGMLGRDNSGFWRIARMAQGDGQTPVEMLAAANMLYNGATHDRARGNVSGTALASAARTVSLTASVPENFNARGMHAFLWCTAGAGINITMQVFFIDDISGQWYDQILTGPITAVGSLLVGCYPGITPVGTPGTSGTVFVSKALPRKWGIYIAHGNANPATYSVGYQLIV